MDDRSITMETLLKMFESVLNAHREQMEHTTRLIEQSEARMSDCHIMVREMTSVCKDLTEKYMSHIDQLCHNRDQMVEQNRSLIQILTILANSTKISVTQ